MVRDTARPTVSTATDPITDITTFLPFRLSTVAAGVRDSHTAVRTVSIRRVRDTVYHTVSLPLIPIIKMPQTEQILPLPQRTDRNLKKSV